MELVRHGGPNDIDKTQQNGVSRVSFERLTLFLGLASCGCGLDLVTKQVAFAKLGSPPSRIWWIWEGYVGLETSINHGALFGMGQGMVPLFAAVSFVAIAGLGVWVLRGDALSSLLLTVALGMITGGILGNLHDRLGLWGHAGVRDWILICYKSWVWPNFNIADSLLVCGAALMMWHSWQHNENHGRESS